MIVDFYDTHTQFSDVWKHFFDHYVMSSDNIQASMFTELAKHNATYLSAGAIAFANEADFMRFLLRWA